MAITSVGTLGTGSSSTSGTTLAFSPSAQLDAGNVGILAISSDNVSTTDGATSLVTGVADSVGNTYTKVGEYTNGEGAAGAGVTCSVWMCRATSNLTTGGTVTITFGSAVIEKCCSFWEFTVGAGLTLATSVVVNAIDAANDFGSAAISGLSSASRLYFRGLAKEANSTTNITPSTGFTVIAAARSRNNVGAVLVRGEFRVNTSTGETSNPVLAVVGDTAGVFAALVESSLFTGTGTLTSSSATLSGSATFTRPVYSGIATLTASSATLSGSATFVAAPSEHPVGLLTQPRSGIVGGRYGSFADKAGTVTVYTAAGVLTATGATLTGVATFAVPVYSGIASLAATSATLTATATAVNPPYTAVATLTASAATLSATATFAVPTYSGVGTLDASSATVSGSATFTPVPTSIGTGTLTATSATLTGTALFAAAVYQGTGTLAATSATLTGSATFTPPVYSGTGTLTATSATLTGVAGVVNPTYSGVGLLIATSATLTASATFSPTVYAAIGTLTASSATLGGEATFVVPTYTGTGTLASSSATLSGSAAFIPVVSAAVATLDASAATLTGSATFTPPIYAASVTLVASSATLTGIATSSIAGTIQGVATLIATSATLGGSAVFVAPTYSGVGSLVAATATLSGSATFGGEVPVAGGSAFFFNIIRRRAS